MRMFFVAAAMLVSLALQAGNKEDLQSWGDTKYRVVINHEEQYSIWFAEREIPAGWKAAEFVGSKKEALDYIEEVWTDMRPLSLRRQIAEENLQKLHKAYRTSVSPMQGR